MVALYLYLFKSLSFNIYFSVYCSVAISLIQLSGFERVFAWEQLYEAERSWHARNVHMARYVRESQVYIYAFLNRNICLPANKISLVVSLLLFWVYHYKSMTKTSGKFKVGHKVIYNPKFKNPISVFYPAGNTKGLKKKFWMNYDSKPYLDSI